MSQPLRISLASIVAITGVIVAWRALVRSRQTPTAIHRPVAPVVAQTRDAMVFDAEITPDSAHSVAVRAVERVEALTRNVALSDFGSDRKKSDFVQAFRSRFAAMILGDFDLAQRDLTARGDATAQDATDDDKVFWLQSVASTRPLRIGIDQMQVRVMYRDGVRTMPPPIDEGFPTLTFRPSADRWGEIDPERDRLDVVEVLYPAAMPQAQHLDRRTPARVLVGWAFAWDDARSQWIPWRTFVYYTDEADLVYAVSF